MLDPFFKLTEIRYIMMLSECKFLLLRLFAGDGTISIP